MATLPAEICYLPTEVTIFDRLTFFCILVITLPALLSAPPDPLETQQQAPLGCVWYIIYISCVYYKGVDNAEKNCMLEEGAYLKNRIMECYFTTHQDEKG